MFWKQTFTNLVIENNINSLFSMYNMAKSKELINWIPLDIILEGCLFLWIFQFVRALCFSFSTFKLRDSMLSLSYTVIFFRYWVYIPLCFTFKECFHFVPMEIIQYKYPFLKCQVRNWNMAQWLRPACIEFKSQHPHNTNHDFL